MSFGISKKSYDYIIYVLSQYPVIEKAGIFGSRAMGVHKNGSDIDLVIYGKDITPEVVNKLSVTLNEELPVPYYFDIVHYDSLENGSLKSHIDKYGKIFYHREKNCSNSQN